MLKRKIANKIEDYLKSKSNKMLIVDGARQIGKSYIISHIGQKMFPNYIEINMERDKQNDRLFAEATSVDKFFFALSSVAGDKMKDKESTLVFIDEIQAYDHLLTLVKFLMEDGRFNYIASGSLLGVTLKKTQSIPIGSISILHMYPLDFEEFLWANNVGELAIEQMKNQFEAKLPLSEVQHRMFMDLFRKYLLVGGLPDAVNTYISEHNIVKVRSVQRDIHTLYGDDAVKYEKEASRKLTHIAGRATLEKFFVVPNRPQGRLQAGQGCRRMAVLNPKALLCGSHFCLVNSLIITNFAACSSNRQRSGATPRGTALSWCRTRTTGSASRTAKLTARSGRGRCSGLAN